MGVVAPGEKKSILRRCGVSQSILISIHGKLVKALNDVRTELSSLICGKNLTSGNLKWRRNLLLLFGVLPGNTVN